MLIKYAYDVFKMKTLQMVEYLYLTWKMLVLNIKIISISK